MVEAAEVIAARGLTKSYRGRGEPVAALVDIDLSVREGEFVAIVGPSGCGKSTLLRIMAGLLPASTGEARFKDAPIKGPRREIGVVFQSPVLFPWRTVLDNVLLPGEIQGLDRASQDRAARDLLALVGLDGFEQRYPWELSGGMQQRVAIVRALVNDPAILLMDEPFGALDAMTREMMNLELQRIWLDRRKTVLFITHSIAEAVFLADRVLVMTPRPGRIMDALDISLERPRALEVVNTPEFGAYARRIRTGLNAQGGMDG